jgi:hypothetical protein
MIPKPAVNLTVPALVADLRQLTVEARRSVPSTPQSGNLSPKQCSTKKVPLMVVICRIADTTIGLDHSIALLPLKVRLQPDFLITSVAQAAWSIAPEPFGPRR